MSTPEPATGRTGLQNTDSLRRLLTLPGIEPGGVDAIAATYDSWEEFLDAGANLPGRSPRRSLELRRIAADTGVPELPEGVRALSRFDDDWPRWLNFDGAPVVVFVRGTLPPGGSIAVVGTRKPTAFGMRAVTSCIAVIRGTVPSTLSGVVSGLDRGIDTLAHQNALSEGVPTWAILGAGVDVPAPTSNAALAERILASGGGLLSEQLPGTRPTAGTLVLRRRLQVAASSRVFVAECGVTSDALHAARYAVELGRRLVVAAPTRAEDVSSPSTAGNRMLLDPVEAGDHWIWAAQRRERDAGRRGTLAAGFDPDAGTAGSTGRGHAVPERGTLHSGGHG